MFVSKKKIFELKRWLNEHFEDLDYSIERVKTFNKEKSKDTKTDLMLCCVFQDEDIQELKETTEYFIETDDIESAACFMDGLNCNLLKKYIESLAQKAKEYEEKSDKEIEYEFMGIAMLTFDIFRELDILNTWIKDKQKTSISKRDRPTTDKRGRPKRDITSKMIEDEDGRKLNKIRSLIKGKIGKDATLIILAAIEKGWMNKPTHAQVEQEFGYIGARQGFDSYLDKKKYDKDELNRAISSLVCD